MTPEDLDIIKRTAIAEGVANNRQAALARAVLDLAGGDEGPLSSLRGQLAELGAKVTTIETAVAALDLPDASALDEALGDLRERVASIEEGLGVQASTKTSRKRS